MAKAKDDPTQTHADPVKDLSADDVLAANDSKIVPVAVPEWGGRVYVKRMTAVERDEFDNSIRGKDDQFDAINYRAKLVLATACTGDGKPLFAPKQLAALAGKSSVAIGRVFAASCDLNALGPGASAEAKKD